MSSINSTQIRKNVSISVVAQIISLIVSLLMNLVLPKYIDELQYSYWQTYLLYIGYVGIFHFGILDGIVLRYSQYDYDQIDKPKIRSQFITILSVSVAMFTLCNVGISFWVNGEIAFILRLVTFGIITRNGYNYTSYSFQITNRINEYVRMVIGFRVFNGVLVIIFIIAGFQQFYWICMADLLSDVFGVLISLSKNRGMYVGKIIKGTEYFQETIKNITSGMMLTLSNWTAFLLSGFSRFVIRSNYGDNTFGKVSFSFSVINLFLTFITAASVVLFPSLKRIEKERLKNLYVKIREKVSLFLYIILILYYPGCFILRLWLPRYEISLRYLAYLLPIIIFTTKINLLTNNYLKAYRKEKTLLVINIVSVTISGLLTLVGVHYFKSLEVVLIFTTCGYIVCSLLAELMVGKILEINIIKGLVEDIIVTAIFIITATLLNYIYGLIVFAVFCLLYVVLNWHRIKSAFV